MSDLQQALARGQDRPAGSAGLRPAQTVPTGVAIALKQHYRQAAWRRQGGRCLYCTRLLALPEVTADHRRARIKGGGDEASNIDATCHGCNQLKGKFSYQGVLRAIHAPSLKRDGWKLHMVGVEIRVMRAAAQAMDRLREAIEPGGAA